MKIVFQRVMAVVYALLAGFWAYLLIHSGVWSMSIMSYTGRNVEFSPTGTTICMFAIALLIVALAIWLLVFAFKNTIPLWAKIVSIVWLCVNGGLVFLIPPQSYAVSLYALFYDWIASGNYSDYMAFPFTATFFVVLSLLTVLSVAINMRKKTEVISNESV